FRVVLAEILNSGAGFPSVGCQPVTNRFLAIILPLNELAAAAVANIRLLWRLGINVVNGPTFGANPAAGDALERQLLVHVNDKHAAEFQVVFIEQLKQHVNLLQRAWETVEENMFAVRSFQCNADDFFDDPGGYQFSRQLIILDLAAQRRAL